MKPETQREMKEELAKVLYVRLPKTIKSMREIQELFAGTDVKVKLPRQSSRHCHVIFSSVEDKLKNMKMIRKVMITGKNIIAAPPRKKASNAERRSTREKTKIRIPKPVAESKITRTLHVSNIEPGTKSTEIKNAFPGCISVIMMKSKYTPHRIALVKLGSTQLAGEYLRKERACPQVRGRVLAIAADTRRRKKKKKSSERKTSSGLKIYNEEDI